VTPLAVAVERKQWEVVALRLAVAVSDVAQRLPPESLAALLDLLDESRVQEERRGN
jgi:hypothetical protein